MIRRDHDDVPTRSTIDAPSSLASSPTVPLDAASTIDRTPDANGETVETAPGPQPGSRSPAPPLRRVEHFVLLERIGAGGMGDVFAAFDDKLQRHVAIKLVATQSSAARARQRLLHEAQALARLSHPNVVTVYEVGTLPDGALFIAMELVKGETLRAWQRQRGGAWREIVAAYAEAGRGLAAAHKSGIVHRDFKPDNALVGSDGRVRVADFGLAYAVDDLASPAADAPQAGDAPPTDAAPQPAVVGDAVEERAHGPEQADRPRLTAAGRFVGTPGYAAPEQLAGTPVDARADQYSFCVALYEALHGERPAPAAPSPSPHGAAAPYPRWLADLLQRGLSVDPTQRFATMDALLAELTRSRERTRRRTAAAVLLGALVAATTTIVIVRSTAEPPPCPLATDELTGVWDPATRQRSQAAILGTGTPFASSTWASTAAAFDRYADRWLAAQQAACKATHIRHVQSADLLDRRIECLASRKRSLAAAADVLQRRPAQAVTHASEILDSLGDIEQCADTGVLLAQSGPALSPDPATRARAATVRQQLANASALLATGDVAAAEPIVAAADTLASDIRNDALHAEVLYLRARINANRSKIADTLTNANQAAQLATASHHDELQADIWLTLALTAGSFEQHPNELASWLKNAESWIQRLNHANDPRRVQLEYARSKLQISLGQPSSALDIASSALQQAEAIWGKEDPRLMRILELRALAEGQLQQSKSAIADAERALTIGIAAFGQGHPAIAQTRRALGVLYIEQLGDWKRARRELTLALQIYRTEGVPASLEVANCEQALSKAEQYHGAYAEALEHAERAEQIYAQQFNSAQPHHGEALMALGVLRYLRKDYAGSLKAYQKAHSVFLATLGDNHTTIGILHSNMGETLLALNRTQAAQEEFASALAILRARLGTKHTDLALPLKGLGLAYLRRGSLDAALTSFEDALAIRTLSGAADDPQEVAEIRWGLARALHALGRDPVRARALAEAAAEGYRSLGSELSDHTAEIERWLAHDGKR